ncbi:hypothetical protein OAP25_01020 [Flavobacteriaceae bacterium]|jgi:hypothetical protein|nr:hypothetical protein [Flavobacteriaceae bacterium]
MGTGVEIALIATAVGSTAASIVQGQKANKAQERAQKIQQKQQAMQTARERRKQIRAARQSQAELRATAFAQGTAQTSRTAGISGNIAQERAGNLNFIDQSSAFTSAIGQQNIKAARAQSQAGTYGALAGLAMQGAQSGLFSGSSSAPAAGGVKDPKTGAIMSPNPSSSSNFFS